MRGFSSRDATLQKTVKPGNTAGTTYSGVIDLGAISEIGVRSEPFEFEVVIPAFTDTLLPAGANATVYLQAADDPDFVDVSNVIAHTVQTDGTDQTCHYRPHLSDRRYWRLACTLTTSSGVTLGDGIDDLVCQLNYLC